MRLGKTYQIKFWDHAINADPIECEAWGRVVGMDKEFIKIACWDISSDDEEFRAENQEVFSIMKRLIIGFGEIRPRRWVKCY